jgi:hypothetical protein
VAGVRKIPDPIVMPTTSATELHNPRVRVSFGAAVFVVGMRTKATTFSRAPGSGLSRQEEPVADPRSPIPDP